jgi:tRNA uridine 5-carboxymethylaminomethyl modification enzyme
MKIHKTNAFDVIVIGGGHAGIEAAYAAAKMGSRTLLLSLKKETIGLMPCNPAVGGVGKGHLVYEVSAMGGLMPKLCTQTYLQVRMLNTRKGPAVQGLRLQIDKEKYSKLSQKILSETPNLTILEGAADTVTVDDQNRVQTLILEDGTILTTRSIVITTGTFLNGRVIIGDSVTNAGRRNERSVSGLATFFKKMNLQLGRLKTGTPPRLLRSSINFQAMEGQEPDNLNYLFEFYPHKSVSTRTCYITHTNEHTHNVIKNNLHRSPLYTGHITGTAPRYCPSIEDKIARFADKNSHHVFVEPEGADHEDVYPNGISTSMPVEVQKEYIQTIKGFENAIISKPGYAVEYDFVLPHQLHETLEVKTVPGLFLAGQINGTTGYEEAAAQGLIAGINAHLKAHNLPSFILDRTESYIGVLINDLTTMSVDEPYRMFTSRAERRLILRQDNSFLRLTPKAYHLGLIDEQMWQDFLQEQHLIEDTLAKLRATHNSVDLMRLFGQEQCTVEQLKEATGNTVSERAAQTVHAEIRYEPYIQREEKEAERFRYYQTMKIADDFVYTHLPGLSKELQQKLSKHKPSTIAQASLIPGMTPAALSLLVVKLKEKKA